MKYGKNSNPLLFSSYTNGCDCLPHREEWEKRFWLYSYLLLSVSRSCNAFEDTAENLVKLAADAWRDMTGME